MRQRLQTVIPAGCLLRIPLMYKRARAHTGKSHGKAESKPHFSKLLSGEFKRRRDNPLPFVPKAGTNAESGEVFRRCARTAEKCPFSAERGGIKTSAPFGTQRHLNGFCLLIRPFLSKLKQFRKRTRKNHDKIGKELIR